jgi:predicted dehydrogenase
VAIVGCGLAGGKRARALGASRLVAAADARPERARRLAASFSGCEAEADWRAAVTRPDVEAVIVSTTNDSLAPVARAAAAAGTHVLVE